MPSDKNKPYKASNFEVFTEVPSGVQRIWWTTGAEDRLSNADREQHNGFALEYLVDAYKAGWDAMDGRLRGKR